MGGKRSHMESVFQAEQEQAVSHRRKKPGRAELFVHVPAPARANKRKQATVYLLYLIIGVIDKSKKF